MSSAQNNFPKMDFIQRSKRAREKLASEKLDAILLTNLTNITWLSGFSGSAGRLVLTEDKMLLVTDGRYDGQAQEQIENSQSGAEVVIENAKQKEKLLNALSNAKRIGLEADDISWQMQRTLDAEWFQDKSAELVPTEGFIVELRRKKDEGEVARIKAAANIADQALEAVLPLFTKEPTEKQVARELESAMFEFGAAGISFETIVAAGKNSARPHARPQNTSHLKKDELILIDMGALVEGYHSDMTRTFTIGDPGKIQTAMYELVSKAQAAGVSTVKAGVSCDEVDAACRDIIAEAGYGEAFSHSTGHGVGLDIHEMPRVSQGSKDILQEGEIITVEPGVYLGDYGGVRIEDTCLVTKNGCEVLTHSEKKFNIS